MYCGHFALLKASLRSLSSPESLSLSNIWPKMAKKGVLGKFWFKVIKKFIVPYSSTIYYFFAQSHTAPAAVDPAQPSLLKSGAWTEWKSSCLVVGEWYEASFGAIRIIRNTSRSKVKDYHLELGSPNISVKYLLCFNWPITPFFEKKRLSPRGKCSTVKNFKIDIFHSKYVWTTEKRFQSKHKKILSLPHFDIKVDIFVKNTDSRKKHTEKNFRIDIFIVKFV